jgi:hypothetical protein
MCNLFLSSGDHCQVLAEIRKSIIGDPSKFNGLEACCESGIELLILRSTESTTTLFSSYDCLVTAPEEILIADLFL